MSNESIRRLDLEGREEVDAVEAGADGSVLVYLAAGYWFGNLTHFVAPDRAAAAEILDTRCHYIDQ